jgi:hypothetical protein
MKDKGYAFLVVREGNSRLVGCTIDVSNKLGYYRCGLFKKEIFNISEGTQALEYKKKPLLMVDVAQMTTFNIGSAAVPMDEKDKKKVDLLLHDDLWRKMAESSLGIVMTLIYLFAGYGIGKLIEYFAGAIFK